MGLAKQGPRYRRLTAAECVMSATRSVAANGSGAKFQIFAVETKPAASRPAILPNTKARSTETAFGAVP